MIRLAVFTATRAEYGILSGLLRRLDKDPAIELQLIVAGSHLSTQHGHTLDHIVADGFIPTAICDTLDKEDSALGMIRTSARTIEQVANALQNLAPDALIVLGDRYELLATAQAATLMAIPLIHIHGGEITEGAFDDAIRHAISQLAHWHFASTAGHRRRLIQMGKSPKRVFNVGALGVDNMLQCPHWSLQRLNASLPMSVGEHFGVLTYHSVTCGNEDPKQTAIEILSACLQHKQLKWLVTYPNVDVGGQAIIAVLTEYAARYPQQICLVPSLGFERYCNALRYATVVVGNSSSALIEAPVFAVPVVNVGLRQLGREAATTTIHCQANQQDISEAIQFALSEAGQQAAKSSTSPYGKGNTADKMLTLIKTFDFSASKTSFFDINFTLEHDND